MPPNLEPMVVTSSPRFQVMNAVSVTAINMPGQWGRSFLRPMMIATVPSERATAAGEMVGSACHRTGIFANSGPGSGALSVRPRRSLIWLAKMITAMPAVKPTVTGKGMNLMKVPSLRKPTTARKMPDRKVARISPSMPCCATVAATSTMKAPAGPPIWKREPPSSETMKPPTAAV